MNTEKSRQNLIEIDANNECLHSLTMSEWNGIISLSDALSASMQIH